MEGGCSIVAVQCHLQCPVLAAETIRNTQVHLGVRLALHPVVRHVVTTALLLLGASCEGMATLVGAQTEVVSAPTPSAPMAAQPAVPPTVLPAPERPEVLLPMERLQLLPFEVRLKRLAAAVELPANDAVFSALRARATDLGAHDFANGVAPDLAWTAGRIATCPRARHVRGRSAGDGVDRRRPSVSRRGNREGT